MAKPIPKSSPRKAAPVAKGKKKAKRIVEITEQMSPKAARKVERKIKDRLDEISERINERYKWAKPLYDAQPADVKAAVDSMVKTMKHMAGPPKFTMDGRVYNVDMDTLNNLQRRSHLWIAMRLLVACAEWGIRIGNFKAPKDECLRCGVKVTKSKPKKKGKSK